MTPKPQHIHVIGICGVATSAIAIAFHKAGWKVTGSDKGFFPPVSTALEEAGVTFYAGWHPEKMIAEGVPDLVLIANASGSLNPETAYVKEHNIPALTDAEIRGKYFSKEHSIVTAGTWGKTSTTALLSFILERADYNPSFVIGGLSLSTDAAKITNGSWSIIEGDEYKTSPWDNRPKFVHYMPTHLLLTAISWDHADLYATEASYFKVFDNLIHETDKKGMIVACEDHLKVHAMTAHARHVTSYGKDANSHYRFEHVIQSREGLSFDIICDAKKYYIESQMLGEYQAENITGCFAMAHKIGIAPEKIIKAIKDFKGLKRRLEKRLEGDIMVLDDIAHSPEKASAVLKNIRHVYSGRIFAIFEPNIGGRKKEAADKYNNAFKDADLLFIPRLSKLKTSQNDNEQERPLEGDELAAIISSTHQNTHYIENDDALVTHLVTSAKKGDVIVFLGSHGFRGMIEDTIQRIGSK